MATEYVPSGRRYPAGGPCRPVRRVRGPAPGILVSTRLSTNPMLSPAWFVRSVAPWQDVQKSWTPAGVESVGRAARPRAAPACPGASVGGGGRYDATGSIR